MSRRRGFTLLELLVALAIVGALLALALGSLRVGLAAWRQGDERAEAHAHLRSLSELLARSVAAAFPYRHAAEGIIVESVLFVGDPEDLAVVTFAPPFPMGSATPFVAVSLTLERGERPGLAVRQKVLPNFEPFEEREPVFVDPAVTAVKFRYLRRGGGWEESWNGAAEEALPQAVEIQLTASIRGRSESLPPLTISIPARAP